MSGGIEEVCVNVRERKKKKKERKGRVFSFFSRAVAARVSSFLLIASSLRLGN